MILQYVLVFVCVGLTFLPIVSATAGPPDPTALPEAPVSVPGSTIPADNLGVNIVEHRGEWMTLLNVQGLGSSMFLVTGQLRNTLQQALVYVKLQVELLDENNVILFRDYVYNRQAEALREEAYETGKKTLGDMKIKPIASATADSFRFIFFKEDVPKFRSYRVRVLEVNAPTE